MRKNKKGFTLVELVIVIAVIAILAGVMIAVFANVVNDAKESAKEQELKQAELEQKSEDIIKKLENADWLSWEDVEVAIAEGLKGVGAGASVDDVENAIDNAIKEYADSLGSGNTGVTEEQIKYIIENSLSGQLTSAQVEAIVKRYQSDPTVSLSASQIAQIKEAASANSLTAAQVEAVAKAVANSSTTTVTDAVKAALAETAASLSTLTGDEVTSIISTTMEKYIRNGVAGDYTALEDALKNIGSDNIISVGGEGGLSVEAFKAIAGLSAEGEDFAGITFEICDDIELTGTWVPIGTDKPFEGSIVGKGENGAPVSITGVLIDTTFNTIKQGYAIAVDKKTGNADKYGVGFIASLGKGGKLENLEITVNYDISDVGADGVLVGGAIGYLDGGTVKNVTVYGSVKNNYRVGGIVGGGYGVIEECYNYADVTSTARVLKSGYHYAAGIVGYARNFAVDKTIPNDESSLTVIDCANHGTITSNDVGKKYAYDFIGQVEPCSPTTLDGATVTNNTTDR